MAKALDLNSYIDREITCSCGHKHYSEVKLIDIDQGAVKRLPGHIKELGYKKIFMVADKNTWAAAGEAAAAELEKAGLAYDKVILDYDEVIPDEHVIGEILAAVVQDSDLILAVGSGTLNDLCKLISYRMGLDYIIYATAPSMDGYASNSSSMIRERIKVSLYTAAPAAIICDIDIIKNAPMRMLWAGFGDMLAKYIAICEWRISHLVTGE